MKKHLILTSLTVILLILIVYKTAAMSSSPAKPTAISDPLLLEAWKNLNDYSEAIHMPDGSNLSGHELAQFVLENDVPIVWGPHSLCGYTSCTIEYHQGDVWIHHRPGEVDPIYINPSLNSSEVETFNELVVSIAHEIYHYSQPFGPVEDTQYEEYLAYYVSGSIIGKAWVKDASLDPLKLANLKQWFVDHNLQYGYSSKLLYPPSVLALVDCPAPDCSLDEYHTSQPTAVNPEDRTSPDYHKLQTGQAIK